MTNLEKEVKDSGLFKLLEEGSLGQFYELIPSFANDSEIYFDIAKNEFIFSDTGYIDHILTCKSVEEVISFTRYFKN